MACGGTQDGVVSLEKVPLLDLLHGEGDVADGSIAVSVGACWCFSGHCGLLMFPWSLPPTRFSDRDDWLLISDPTH